MKLLITGANGFIGQALCQHWQTRHQLTLLHHGSAPSHHTTPASATAQHRALTQLTDLDGIDAVINLAGAPLMTHRWSPARRQALAQSRWETTAYLVDRLRHSRRRPRVWLNASAVGYYGWHDDEPLDETHARISPGFTHEICARWETLAEEASQWGARVCLLRLGLVLGRSGGVLASMLPAYRLGLGAILGDGRQIYSWIALPDLLRALDFLLEHNECQGPFNLTSPAPVSQADFSCQLAQALHRPHWLRLPAGLLTGMLGERADLLLKGQKVLPTRLREAGFVFRFASLPEALAELVP